MRERIHDAKDAITRAVAFEQMVRPYNFERQSLRDSSAALELIDLYEGGVRIGDLANGIGR